MISTKTYALAAGAVAVAGVAAMYVLPMTRMAGDDVFAQCRASSVAGGAGSIGGPFTLVNTAGQTVTDSEVITKPSLVYFGYTFCPDVCPLDNARNAEAVDLLDQQGIDAAPVFISIDPARDTPEVLADFAEVMHPKMIGLTGSPEQVKAASLAYKTYFKIRDPEEEFYLMDHSTYTYLVLPQAGFVEFFKREDTPQQMAETVACFVNAAK